MHPGSAFRVTFWGVTGSYPRPQTAAELRAVCARETDEARPFTYGGDTTCIEIQAGDERLIVDAGTGLQRLSRTLASRDAASPAARGTILLTHAHLDHVCSLPFFEPFYDPRSDFAILGAARTIDALQQVGRADEPLAGVFFPQTMDQMPGLKRCEALTPGESMVVGDVRVSSLTLHHPGGSLGYRIDWDGKSVVIATDHEQQATPDWSLADFASGADLLYMDAQYLRSEYEGLTGVAGDPAQPRFGWGHTPLEDCLPTALAAGVSRLYLGHHEPRRSDAGLRDIAAKLHLSLLAAKQGAFSDACGLHVELAYQGLSVDI